MKVNPINQNPSSMNTSTQVKEKSERSEQGFQEKLDQQEKKEEQQSQENDAQSTGNPEDAIVVDEKNVQEAIEGFSKDIHADSNGLKATASGQGPGLKVILKDGSGAVIRQWSGEEFLKLRKAASNDSGDPKRGKILDQKL